MENNILDKKTKALLAIEKVVDYLNIEILNLEEVWIRNNPLEITIENTDRSGELCRHTLNFDTNLEFINLLTIDTVRGKESVDSVKKKIESLSPDLSEVEEVPERLVLRMTTNYKYELEVAKKNLLANSLFNSLDKKNIKTLKVKL